VLTTVTQELRQELSKELDDLASAPGREDAVRLQQMVQLLQRAVDSGQMTAEDMASQCMLPTLFLCVVCMCLMIP